MKKIFLGMMAITIVLSFAACHDRINGLFLGSADEVGEVSEVGEAGEAGSPVTPPSPEPGKYLSLKSVTFGSSRYYDGDGREISNPHYRDVITFHYDGSGRLIKTDLSQLPEDPRSGLKISQMNFTYYDNDRIKEIESHLEHSFEDTNENVRRIKKGIGKLAYSYYEDGKLHEVIFHHQTHGPYRKISVTYQNGVATWHLYYRNRDSNNWVKMGPNKGDSDQELMEAITDGCGMTDMNPPDEFFERTIEYNSEGFPKKDSYYSLASGIPLSVGIPSKMISEYKYDDDMRLSSILSIPEPDNNPTADSINRTTSHTIFNRSSKDGTLTDKTTQLTVKTYDISTGGIDLKSKCKILKVVKRNSSGAILEEELTSFDGACRPSPDGISEKKTITYEYTYSDVEPIMPPINKISTSMFPTTTLYGVDEPALIFGRWDGLTESVDLISYCQLLAISQ